MCWGASQGRPVGHRSRQILPRSRSLASSFSCSPRRSGTPTQCTFAMRSSAPWPAPRARGSSSSTRSECPTWTSPDRAHWATCSTTATASTSPSEWPGPATTPAKCSDAAAWRSALARATSTRASIRRSPPSRTNRGRPPDPEALTFEKAGRLASARATRPGSRCHPGPQGRRARRHDPARGADEGELLIGVARHGPSLVAVHQVMVVQTGQGQIVEVGAAPGFPRKNVVHIGEGHVGTAREPTMSVPPQDLSALRLGRETAGPALLHGVPDVVVDPNDDGGVTSDPLQRLDVDQTAVLELAGQHA